MTPRCTNCLHWDEETAEDNPRGLGICLDQTEIVSERIVRLTRVAGDYACPSFEGKTVPHVVKPIDR